MASLTSIDLVCSLQNRMAQQAANGDMHAKNILVALSVTLAAEQSRMHAASAQAEVSAKAEREAAEAAEAAAARAEPVPPGEIPAPVPAPAPLGGAADGSGSQNSPASHPEEAAAKRAKGEKQGDMEQN